MKKSIVILVLAMMSTVLFGVKEITDIKSDKSFGDTIRSLQAILKEKDFREFVLIDHAQRARDVFMEPSPFVLIIFGSPRGGTQLMRQKPRLGLDLPLKYPVWEDSSGQVWISFRDPFSLAHMYR